MDIHSQLQQRLELTRHNQAAKSIRSDMRLTQYFEKLRDAKAKAKADPSPANTQAVKTARDALAAASVSRQHGRSTPTATKPAAVAPAATKTAAPAAATITPQALAAAIVDEQEARAAAAKIKTRAEFDALSHKDRAAFIKAGGKLTD